MKPARRRVPPEHRYMVLPLLMADRERFHRTALKYLDEYPHSAKLVALTVESRKLRLYGANPASGRAGAVAVEPYPRVIVSAATREALSAFTFGLALEMLEYRVSDRLFLNS